MLSRRSILKSILIAPFLPVASLAKMVSPSAKTMPFEFVFADAANFPNISMHLNVPYQCSDAMIQRLSELVCQYPMSQITIERGNAHWNQS
jgi:hypothetical protein